MLLNVETNPRTRFTMDGSAEDLGPPPDSWEVADLDASMTRLMRSSSSPIPSSSSSLQLSHVSASSSSSTVRTEKSKGVSEDVINSVDQFLREALENPRERLSVLRMEQDVEKFILDRTQQQMEFQQLPTSYLRLAAHRVAQHYSLQSMVLLDNNLPDSSGSRIIVRKTSESRLPLIRLADIPVNLPTEESDVLKVAIKQRPQRRSQVGNSANMHSMKNNSKTVEERKEEYNRARARIFNSSSSNGGTSVRPETEQKPHDNLQHGSSGLPKVDVPVRVESSGWDFVDSSASRSRSDNDLSKANSRVAIFRDRDNERRDPDYDRHYERYTQRFDPGFGFSGIPYTIQPLFTPALNYNTEFPQLGSVRPAVSSEQQPRPLPQHLPVPWSAPPTPTGMVYGHPDALVPPFSPNHIGLRSTSPLYLHPTQYPCHQRLVMPFVIPQDQVQQFSQSHQQQPDASFGLARPR
ncbi:cAMP-regulated phosphoprotein 21-like [Impatiens glandulifera]|uniref:cAMP-regulated phosphoprotein 21-like n=1 Tax=Impatiens glandulifera TaxID=253017 RepID=UPI001FB10C52|nr:cAMP-regulated phosphoprotein 21-like [Impatiens glandulifera]